MTSPAPILNFQQENFKRLYADYQAAHDTTKQAWMAEIKAATALKESGTWKQYAKTWREFCSEELGMMPYRANSYSSYYAELPLAEIIETTTDKLLTPNQSRQIREKIRDIIEPEDKQLIAEVWNLAYAAKGEIVPNANVIKAAYEVIKQERDNRSVSINGESFDIKAMAQKMAVKEAVLENIQAHNQSSQKWSIEVDSFDKQKAIQALLPTGMKAPAIGAMVTLLWKKEAK